jgi:hypothetical protein
MCDPFKSEVVSTVEQFARTPTVGPAVPFTCESSEIVTHENKQGHPTMKVVTIILSLALSAPSLALAGHKTTKTTCTSKTSLTAPRTRFAGRHKLCRC